MNKCLGTYSYKRKNIMAYYLKLSSFQDFVDFLKHAYTARVDVPHS